MRSNKRFLCLMLAVIMIVGMLPVPAGAVDPGSSLGEVFSGGGFSFSGYQTPVDNKVTITFIDQNSGGATSSKIEIAANDRYTLPAGPSEAKDNGNRPTIFYGWSTDVSFSKKDISSANQLSSLLSSGTFFRAGTEMGPATKDETYYAVWARQDIVEQFSLSFESGSQSWEYDGQSHTYHVYTAALGSGSSVTAIANNNGSNYVATLSNGYTATFIPDESAVVTEVSDGEVANSFTVIVRDRDGNLLKDGTNYMASYQPGTLRVTAPEEITFIYTASEGGMVQVANGAAAAAGSETVHPVNGTPAGAVPVASEGYLFDGWYTDPDFTTPVAGESVDAATNRVTPSKSDGSYTETGFYAKFTAAFKLVYDLNGGNSSSIPAEELYASPSAMVTVTGEVPFRSGFDFKGWALDAKAAEPDFDAGEKAALSEMLLTEESTLATLYAVWTRTRYSCPAEVGYYEEDGSWHLIKTVAIPTGKVADRAPVLDGEYSEYIYAYSQCVGTDGSDVRVDYLNAVGDDNGVTYYHSLASEVIGTKVRSGETIRLVYETQTVLYNVSYQLYVKRYGEADYSLCEDIEFSDSVFTGPSTITKGEDLVFTSTLPAGYSYDSIGGFYKIMYGSGAPKITKVPSYKDAGSNRTFTLSSANIESNVTNGVNGSEIYIVVYLIEKNCTLSWNGSNTLFIASDGTESHVQRGSLQIFEQIVGKTDTYFYLYPYHNTDGPNGATPAKPNPSNKELNLVNIKINGVTVSLDLSNGAATNLPDGSVATITNVENTRFEKEKELAGQIKDYISAGDAHLITIHNDKGFHSSIEVYSNHKNVESYEYWLVSVNGIVKPTAKNSVNSKDGVPNVLMVPGSTSYLGMSGAGKTGTLYFNIEDGYSTELSDITATMLVNKTSTRNLTVYKLSEDSNGYKAGYRYCVYFTSVSGEKDNRISLSSVKKIYSVRYDVNGGTPETYMDSRKYNGGEIISAGSRLSMPEKTECVFKGWELLDENGNRVKLFRHGDPISVEEYSSYFVHQDGTTDEYAITLRAVWADKNETDEYTVQITAMLPDGTVLYRFTEPTYKVDHIVVGAEAVDRKVLANAQDLPENFDKIYSLSGDKIVTWKELEDGSFNVDMVYDYRTYSVVYKLDGGKSDETLIYTGLHYGDETPSIGDPTKDHGVFADWKGVVNANGIYFTGVKPTVTGNTVYTAQWGYTLTIHYRYAKTDPLKDTVPFEDYTGVFPAGGVYNVYETEKVLTGFSRDRNGIAGIMGTKGAEYTVTFNRNTYTVSYKLDGAAYGSSQKFKYGETLTLLDRPVKAGYKVSDWQVESPASITSVPATMPATDLVLKAVSEKNMFTVTFKDYDGSTLKDATEYIYGTKATDILQPTAVRTGYTFAGWSPALADVTENAVYTATYEIDHVGSITVKASDAEKTYDGTALTTDKFTVTEGALRSGDRLAVEIEGSITNAGSSESTIKSLKILRGDADVTFCYTVTMKPGTLTVSPKAVSVSAIDTGKVFNREDPELKAKVEGILGSDKIDYSLKRDTGENAGKYTITVSGDSLQGNYSVSYVPGTFTISPVTDEIIVTITGAKNTLTYNGKAQNVTGYTVESISNALYKESDFTFNGTAKAERTDAGTTVMGLSAAQFANNSKNFSNVTFAVTDGALTIKPLSVSVEITGKKDTKVYNGQKQSVTGYDVKSSSELYSESSFTFSGSKLAERTDVGTTAMGLAKEQFSNNDSNFTVSFSVTDGSLTITPVTEKVTVTIAGSKDSKIFNGGAQNVTGYSVKSISNSLYTENDFVFNGTANAERTDVGTTAMGLAGEQFANRSENFSNVTFAVTDGALTITPKSVTVTAIDNGKVYGSAEPELKAKVEGTLGSDTVSYSLKRAAGENVKTYAITPTGDKLQGNYSVTYVPGTFTITKVSDVVVYITGSKDSKTYDGTKLSVTGYSASFSNSLYTESDFSFNGTAKAERTDAGTTVMGLKKEQFSNANSNFDKVTFVVTDGSVTIDPLAVSVEITGNTDKQVYNGQKQSVTGYDVKSISSSLYKESDLAFNGTAKAERTDAGSTVMGLAKEQFANNNKNFTVSFTVTDGSLTITPVTEKVTVTIAGSKDSKTFNGGAQNVTGYSVKSISNSLYTENDFVFNGTAKAERTDVGTTAMGLAGEQFANSSKNFSHVEFAVTDGALTIDPLAVTVKITGKNNTKTYDGEVHSVTGYEVSDISSKLYTESQFTFSGAAGAERRDAGTTFMGLTKAQFTNNNKNFTVSFEVSDGFMTVKPIDEEVVVAIEGKSDSQDYTAVEQSVTGYTVKSISNALYKESDILFTGSAEAKRTDAGKTEMGLTGAQFANGSKNFSHVKFEITDGAMTVKPLAVTVTADDTGKSFGEEDPGLTATVKGTLGSDEVAFTLSRESGEAVGYYTITVTAETTQGNYTVSTAEGEFTIDPAIVTLSLADAEKRYGEDDPDPDELVTITGLVGEDSIPFSVKREEGENVREGGYRVFAEVEGESLALMTLDGEDGPAPVYYGNYVVMLQDATMNILPREVVLSSGDAQRVYNGTVLTNHSVSVSGDGFVEGEGAEYTVTGEQLLAGGSAENNTFTYSLQENTLAGNYDIRTVFGTLIVTPVTKELVVTAASDAKTYDSLALSNAGYTCTQGVLAEGDRVEAIVEGSITDSGHAENKVTGVKILHGDTDVTESYTLGESVNGTLEIRKRNVILQSHSDAKVYDGTPLRNTNDPIIAGDGFAEGEGAVYSIFGAQTYVGSGNNEFTYTLQDNTKAENYEITTQFGILVVSPVPVYTLTIHYVDEGGKTVSPDYVNQFAAGAVYYVNNPAVESYSPAYRAVSSPAAGMPAQDLAVTVVYSKNAVPAAKGEITETENGFELVTIHDTVIPLSEMVHKDDIMHFLLMALAFVVQVIYMEERKKYQKKIFELKKELGEDGDKKVR